MAPAIPKMICLTATGHRRQGQTKRNPYQSLHGHRVSNEKANQGSAETELDIDAPPHDSSDEKEVTVFEAEGYGEASDDSEFEVTARKPGSSPRKPAFSPRSATSGSPLQSLRQSSQKRKSEHGNDEKLNMSFEASNLSKGRKGVGYGKSKAKAKPRNIHEKQPVGQTLASSVKKKNSLAAGESSSGFIKPPTEGLLAELNKCRAKSAASTSPSSGASSPPAKQRKRFASQSIKTSPKASVFKAPKLPSPPPKEPSPDKSFRQSPIAPEQRALSRARSPTSRRTKPSSRIGTRSKNGVISSSASIAATKLGLEDVGVIASTSNSTVYSSTAKSTDASRLASPPTSYIDDATTADIPLPRSKDESFSESPRITAMSQSSQSPVCPLCRQPVDGLYLEGFAGNRRMTIREQAQFCKAHKRRTAEEEWQSKGYPQIDWPFLHMQVKIHSEAIEGMLRNEEFSFYRNAYEDYLKREKHQTLQQSLVRGGGIEDFSPGYYGSRGARIMIDNLMSTFSSKLRRRSSSDNLISSRGISSYVRAVLVPELATLLVMDDMKIDAEEARQVLHESVELGNFLNEEEDEVIKDPDVD